MVELKGIEKLNKRMSAQLAPFGISSAAATDEYSYSFVNESITFQITEGSFADKCFNEFIKDRFDYECSFPFVLYLLHEIGHHKTNDSIDDLIYDFCMSEKSRIEDTLAIADTEELAKKLHYQYFNLPDEIMATQWAVNYAKSHPQKIEQMAKDCKNILMDFYKENLDPSEFE